ncbi:MAG: hypothetical protein ABIQ29_00745 [Burkholderiaceae bacterium]
MSIAAITSSFITAVRERAVPASQTPAEPVDEVRGAVKGGRRHELVDAMQQVLGSDSVDGKSGQQAVFRFAHALMHDLRKIDAGADGPTPGVGHAWGRRSYSDLSQRLETLATASTTPATPVTPATLATPSTPIPVELPTPPVVDAPVQPDPLTATSAALHLMQVPTSRLLEAYAALRQALGDGEPAPSAAVASPPAGTSTPPPDANRAALAEFLTQLSTTLSAQTPASLPAGSLVNVRA